MASVQVTSLNLIMLPSFLNYQKEQRKKVETFLTFKTALSNHVNFPVNINHLRDTEFSDPVTSQSLKIMKLFNI